MDHDEYPACKAWDRWEINGRWHFLVKTEMGHWCGYVEFPKRPTIEQGYGGILTYVPVHGGITYAENCRHGEQVYGFDCAHSGDETRPNCWSVDWLKTECERMGTAIQEAVAFEEFYLLARSNELKAEVIQMYHDKLSEEHGISFDLRDNFGALIGAMFGSL